MVMSLSQDRKSKDKLKIPIWMIRGYTTVSFFKLTKTFSFSSHCLKNKLSSLSILYISKNRKRKH